MSEDRARQLEELNARYESILTQKTNAENQLEVFEKQRKMAESAIHQVEQKLEELEKSRKSAAEFQDLGEAEKKRKIGDLDIEMEEMREELEVHHEIMDEMCYAAEEYRKRIQMFDDEAQQTAARMQLISRESIKINKKKSFAVF